MFFMAIGIGVFIALSIYCWWLGDDFAEEQLWE